MVALGQVNTGHLTSVAALEQAGLLGPAREEPASQPPPVFPDRIFPRAQLRAANGRIISKRWVERRSRRRQPRPQPGKSGYAALKSRVFRGWTKRKANYHPLPKLAYGHSGAIDGGAGIARLFYVRSFYMSTPGKEEFCEAVSHQLDAYTKLFQAQVEVTQEPPKRFHFPEPANEVERTAMRIFIEMVEEKSKTQVQSVHCE